jgi:hypothetical protein
MARNLAGSLVLTGVPTGLVGEYLRYTGAGKLNFERARRNLIRADVSGMAHFCFEGLHR